MGKEIIIIIPTDFFVVWGGGGLFVSSQRHDEQGLQTLWNNWRVGAVGGGSKEVLSARGAGALRVGG